MGRVPLMSMPNAQNLGTSLVYAPLPNSLLLTDPDRSVYRVKSTPADHNVTVGHGLGGTSRVNAMIYTRGLKEEYDRWNIPGWSYDELDCFFKKSEGHTDITASAVTHGLTGAFSVLPVDL